jgi:hypothetical protein
MEEQAPNPTALVIRTLKAFLEEGVPATAPELIGAEVGYISPSMPGAMGYRYLLPSFRAPLIRIAKFFQEVLAVSFAVDPLETQ